MAIEANTNNKQSGDKIGTITRKKERANMHDGIAVWCDCCSCEAEPRWLELAGELGIDMSDYEEE